MKYTCNKCKNEFDFKENHMEMNLPGLQLFLCNNCICRERSKREDSIPEWGAGAPLSYDEWEKRCGALNTMET